MSSISWVQKFTPGVPLRKATSASSERQVRLSERSEPEIIRLAQAGDAQAFEHLYKVHCRRVYAVCLRMTSNPSLSEDLTQEAFLQVFRKIQTFRAESAFSTWLYRLAVNIVLMRHRIKRLNETPLEGTHEKDGENLPPREIGRLDSRVSGTVERLNLKNALAQLPPGYRQVFVLHDVWGYEHHEIAQALDCSIGTSKSQLHKARMRLRKILQRGQLGKASLQNSAYRNEFRPESGTRFDEN